jgi:hypothetical protein
MPADNIPAPLRERRADVTHRAVPAVGQALDPIPDAFLESLAQR